MTRLRRLAASLAASGICLFFIGWGGGARALPADHLTLLSLNACDDARHVADLRDLCDRFRVDGLCLQEVSPEHRREFVEGLPQFDFYWGDETKELAHDDKSSFSSITGFSDHKAQLVRFGFAD